MTPDPFPWNEAMRFGFGVLRLGPSDFWALTPRELAAAMRAHMPETQALDRAGLAGLMARFPDGAAMAPFPESATAVIPDAEGDPGSRNTDIS